MHPGGQETSPASSSPCAAARSSSSANRVPSQRIEVETPETLPADLIAKLGPHFTDMTTDLEAFDTDPLVQQRK